MDIINPTVINMSLVLSGGREIMVPSPIANSWETEVTKAVQSPGLEIME